LNSREKGKRGERQWRDELRANGYCARRGQQFAGGTESPDVICDGLPWIHFEVKAVEKLNIEAAMEQARGDCGTRSAECGMQKVPVVAHRRSFRPWLVTMEAETFFRFLRGDFLNHGSHGLRGKEFTDLTGANRENGGEPELLTAEYAEYAKADERNVSEANEANQVVEGKQ
jgi:Holliday junction resolvase